MPSYRRNFVAGGCYFFTVNLLERQRTPKRDGVCNPVPHVFPMSELSDYI